MKNIFPFFGAKWRAAKLYGPPRRPHVIEPFAGSAGYSLFWEPAQVTLIEKDPTLVELWTYLIRVTTTEILHLPDLAPGGRVDELPSGVCREARDLIGFWCNKGSSTPKKTMTRWTNFHPNSTWGPVVRERIAYAVERIRHWRVHFGSYETFGENPDAHWFIDPPYVEMGKYYRHRKIDFAQLGEWCRSRNGAVDVCEAGKADWLPFSPLASIKSTRGHSHELLWTR